MKTSFNNALNVGDKLQSGKYLIVEIVGQTHFGITYLCIHTYLNEKVILKEFILRDHSMSRESGKVVYKYLNPDVCEKFRNIYLEESRALSRCSTNEHIVDVKDIFEENGTIYSVTNYIFEEDLRTLIYEESQKHLSEEEAIKIITQIADGLKFMHYQGIYHLGLSPEKIILSKKGNAVIFDIGVARHNVPAEVLEDITALNKPGYSAPEQYLRNSEQGIFTDIYSLGAIFYFLLTGTDPPPAFYQSGFKKTEIVKSIKPISKKVTKVIQKAMSPEPSGRYSTIDDFLNDLADEKSIENHSHISKKHMLFAGVFILLLVLFLTLFYRNIIIAPKSQEELIICERDTTSRSDSESLWTYGDESTVYLGVGETRGGRPVSYTEKSAGGQKDSVKIGKYYAVLIGVEDYDDKQLKLNNPVSDALMLKNVLDSNYIFDHIVLLRNPNREEIFTEFESLQERMTENDNLLLFYAGHGQYDPRTKKGYWLPRDAKQSNISNWISNDQLKDFLSTMKARHIMLITDACFGGSISRGTNGSVLDSTPLFTKMTLQLYKRKSIKSLSSGFLEKVPDKSPFVHYLIENLNINDKNVLSGLDLFYSTKMSLEKGCSKEVPYPIFDVIQTGVDNGGDFFFIKRAILKNKGYMKISN